MRRLWVVALACAAVLAAQAGAAQAAAPAPAWQIFAIPFPTAFEAGSAYKSLEAGPGYQVQAYNVGGAPTTGPFTITDTLPGPLRPVAGFAPSGTYGPPSEGALQFKLSCAVAGHTITCTGVGVVGPGEGVTLTVPVEVEASATGTLLDKAKIEGGGAAAAVTTSPTQVSSAPSPFGFVSGQAGLFGFATAVDGQPATGAGSHPYEATVAGMTLAVNPNGPGIANLLAAGGGLREVVAELPRGLVVNPEATKQCTETELHEISPGCPNETQVGTVAVTVSIGRGFGQEPFVHPLFNMVPPPGHPAELGFEVTEGVYVHLLGAVRSDGSFTLTAASKDTLAKVAIGGVRTVLWGNPTDASHDSQRGACLLPKRTQPRCPTERTGKAFVTLPSSCGGPLITTAHIDSWLDPGTVITRSYESTDLEGNSVGVSGCNALEFEPTIESKATTNVADSPSGLEFDLHQRQNEEFEGRSTANLENAKVTLPQGMVLNPAAANGRDACSSPQIRLATAVGQTPIRFEEKPQTCPDAAKIGTVEVTTPLLDHSLPGSVYLAKPFDNPFGSLLAIYLAIEDEHLGVIAKLAGKVEADPTSGQLTTSFAESPELPLEDVRLHLFNGPRAALTTPLTCGTKTTTSVLTPWSTPEGADAHPSDSFQTTVAPGGGTCPAAEAGAPNAPAFTAGTLAPQAGAYSPFVLKLTRPDGSQRLTSIDATLPEGLTGKLAGIPYCSEAQIAAAQARHNPNEGALEKVSPSCPLASEVGTVNVGAGSGPTPIYVQGHAYLAGPYKGAPLSLVIITPAVAGPFDLGDVVVRTALYVNLETAQIHAVSDPLPTIIAGIPLDVRSVALNMDRPSFTLNPTSCDPMTLLGAATAASGQVASLSQRFQVGGCSALKFAPKLAIKLKGGTKRHTFPALTATVTYPKGSYANIKSASVALPHSEFLEQNHIGTVCTNPQFAADACPKASIYGEAEAITPLLEKPLKGPVYLRTPGHKLPDLVADLRGQIEVTLRGRIDTDKADGIRTTFESAPDAPITKFVLRMKGGSKGLLVNSENICAKPQRATVKLTGQNAKTHNTTPLIANSCKAKKKKPTKSHGSR
jgi:hypothetical protein